MSGGRAELSVLAEYNLLAPKIGSRSLSTVQYSRVRSHFSLPYTRHAIGTPFKHAVDFDSLGSSRKKLLRSSFPGPLIPHPSRQGPRGSLRGPKKAPKTRFLSPSIRGRSTASECSPLPPLEGGLTKNPRTPGGQKPRFRGFEPPGRGPRPGGPWAARGWRDAPTALFACLRLSRTWACS